MTNADTLWDLLFIHKKSDAPKIYIFLNSFSKGGKTVNKENVLINTK